VSWVATWPSCAVARTNDPMNSDTRGLRNGFLTFIWRFSDFEIGRRVDQNQGRVRTYN